MAGGERSDQLGTQTAGRDRRDQKIEKAERAYELEKVAELRYGRFNELEAQLGEAELVLESNNKSTLLKEEVELCHR